MSVQLITGFAGKPHVKAEDDRSLIAAIFGEGKYVLKRGNRLACEIVSNNLIRIKNGDAINQGAHIRIEENDYEEVIIDNGSQGFKRIDLIVLRYEKDYETKVESASIVVIKGTESNNPVVPEYEKGNLYDGDIIDDMPLYKINIEGINIISVDRMFNYVVTMDDIFDIYKSLFNKGPLFIENPKSDYNKLNTDQKVMNVNEEY